MGLSKWKKKVIKVMKFESLNGFQSYCHVQEPPEHDQDQSSFFLQWNNDLQVVQGHQTATGHVEM